MAMTYEDIKELIADTLTNRPKGTEITPEGHQEIEMQLLEYIRNIELTCTTPFIDIATASTVPVEPDDARVCYIGSLRSTQSITFLHFRGEDGNQITIPANNFPQIYILIWNTAYWEYITVIIDYNSSLIRYTKHGGIKIGPGTGKEDASPNSMVLGYGSMAMGTDGALGAGKNTSASGQSSHAEGTDTVASGYGSHSEGNGTKASGQLAHSEGNLTTARGNFSHSEGNNTHAIGLGSHSEGYSFTAPPEVETVEELVQAWDDEENPQRFSVAGGDYSHVEGEQNFTVASYSHAEGRQNIVRGKHSHAEGYANDIKESATFGAHAEGQQNIVSAQASHAEGKGNVISVDAVFSHAEGEDNEITGIAAHAEGNSVVVSGTNSHGEGYNNKVNGHNAHGEGENTVVDGRAAHAEGNGAQATGYGAHAEGLNTKSSASYSHAEGSTTEASGDNAHAEGANTVANKPSSHAEGYSTIADGIFGAHAEGQETHASGQASHAQGLRSMATYPNSHASGVDAHAEADSAHAMGCNVYAENCRGVVIGQYNTKDSNPSRSYYSSSKPAFVIGNGTSDTARSDAFKVLGNGTVYADNTTIQPMADYAEMFEWADGNPDAEDRIGYFVALQGNKIKKATGADKEYILGIISGTAAIIGDAPMRWNNKYLTDEWGRPIYETIKYTENETRIKTDEEGNQVLGEDGTYVTETISVEKSMYVRKLNPDYNPDLDYVPREQRPEWGVVGLLGKVLVRQDGTLTAGEYCMPNENGIAVKSDTGGFYVLEIINETQARVFVK